MKKVLTASMLSVLVFITPVFSKKWSVSVNPLGLLFGIANARVEYLAEGKLSYFGGGAFASVQSLGLSASAIGAELGVRRYFSENHKGAFLEGGAGLLNLSLKDDFGNTASGTIIYPFGLVGYRLGSSFFLDAGIGANYYIGRVDVNGSTIGAFSGLSLNILLGLGLKF